MSYTTINICVNDTDLQDRVRAAASKEAWAGAAEFSWSEYGVRLRTYPGEAIGTFMYVIAIDNEDGYAYALETGVVSPGKDRGVISDEQLQAGIQAHWPISAEVPAPTDMVEPTPGQP